MTSGGHRALKESDTFYIIDREEWKNLHGETDITMSEEELESLRSLNDKISIDDVKEVYVPMLQVLHVHLKHYTERQNEIQKRLNQPQKSTPYIIGVAGSVAVGKSTLARLLQMMMSRVYKDKKVELITTDGFLFPNAVLEERGIMDRKGFPESYNMPMLLNFLADIKNGKPNVKVPVYSHKRYDIVPDKYHTLDQPDILIVEGINVLQLPANEKIFVSDFFDFSFYMDAEPRNIEKWYLQRFGVLLQTAYLNPDDYYHSYAVGNRQEAFEMARGVWKRVNLTNLHQYILPTRFRADMIIHKTTNHYVDQILLRKH